MPELLEHLDSQRYIVGCPTKRAGASQNSQPLLCKLANFIQADDAHLSRMHTRAIAEARAVRDEKRKYPRIVRQRPMSARPPLVPRRLLDCPRANRAVGILLRLCLPHERKGLRSDPYRIGTVLPARVAGVEAEQVAEPCD